MIDKSVFSKHHKIFPDGWHVRHINRGKHQAAAAYNGVNKAVEFQTWQEAQTYCEAQIRTEQASEWFLYRMPVRS